MASSSATIDGALQRRLDRVLHANRRARDPDAEPLNRLPMLQRLQRWQADRLRVSFARFLADPRTAPAAEFFLQDLYGDHDVSARDRGVERVLPMMQRLLPEHLIETAADAIELAVISHRLDMRVAEALAVMADPGQAITEDRYAKAYREAGLPRVRQYQIDLVVHIGQALDTAVAKPWLGRVLRMARLPARAAGLQDLQLFLERGFAAFTRLHGADDFLLAVEAEERQISRRLFEGHPQPFALD